MHATDGTIPDLAAPRVDEDVFIVGAGFSRAVSEAMPLTDELGTECLGRLRFKDNDESGLPVSFNGGNFETFLSVLAVDQPYLSKAENLRNRRLFAQLSDEIASVLTARQHDAMCNRAPDWLQDLLSIWHYNRSAVVTFNYDTLIECAAAGKDGLLNAPSHVASAGFPWPDLTNNQPPWPPGLSVFGGGGGPAIPTFELLKLHGSTNWFWNPDDPTGMTAARRDLPGTYGAPEIYAEVDRVRHWPGRAPMIIPPTASKSGYYQVPLLQEIWQRARARLRMARRVYVLGYSLPLTDFSTRDMLRSALLEGQADLIVADKAPDVVAGNFENAEIPFRSIKASHHHIEFLATALAEIASERVVGEIQEISNDGGHELLAVHWGDRGYSAVTAVRTTNGRITLIVDPPSDSLMTGLRQRGPSDQPAATVNDLAAAGRGRGLWVEINGEAHPLVQQRHVPMQVGATNTWRMFTSSRARPGV